MNWRYILVDHHVRTLKCIFGYHDREDVEGLALVNYDVCDEWGMGYGGPSHHATVSSVARVSVKRCKHCQERK